MNSCNNCIHSRPIISENGISYKCTLSSSQATKCLCGEQRFYKSYTIDTEEFINKYSKIPCLSFLVDTDFVKESEVIE